TTNGGELFALFGETHINTTFNLSFIEGVQGLAKLKQNIVGHIHYRVYGTQATATQTFLQPYWALSFQVHIADNASEVARAGVRRCHFYRYGFLMSGYDSINLRGIKRHLIKCRHFAGHTTDA